MFVRSIKAIPWGLQVTDSRNVVAACKSPDTSEQVIKNTASTI